MRGDTQELTNACAKLTIKKYINGVQKIERGRRRRMGIWSVVPGVVRSIAAPAARGFIMRTGYMRIAVLCSAGSALLSGFSSPTRAQTVAAAERSGLEEIVVTARRREENLQAVPISVTAMSGEQLAESGVTTVRDLQAHVPSLVVNTQGTDRMVVGFGIRGMRSASFLVLDDPAVGTYFAEGLQARTYGFGEMLFDIASVQVLKGPQGTLFGRNNTGGAILVEPNKPKLSTFEANAKVIAGDYSRYGGEATVNIPMGSAMSLRVAGSIDKRNGYSKNLLSGQEWDGVDTQAARVSFLIKPSDALSSNTIFDYLHADQSPSSSRLVGFTPLVSAGFRTLFTPSLNRQQARDISDFESLVGSNGPNDGFAPFRCAANPLLKCRSSTEPRIRLKNWGVLNNTSFQLTDSLTLKNIVSYRDILYHNEGVDNLSGSALGIQSNQRNESNTLTEELQLQGKSFGGSLDWIFGGYFLRERGSEFAPNYQFTVANWNATTGSGENKSWAAFAQGTYHFTPALSATLGGRFTWDKRIAHDDSYTISGSTGAKTCQVRAEDGTPLPVNACTMTGESSFSEPTWTASVEYKATDDILLYGTSRRGYKSGGFSLRAHRPQRFGYRPEFVTDFEAGLKADWDIGIPLRTNLAVYYSKYKDIQRQVTDTTLTPTVTYVFNAAKAHVTGGEFEFTVIPLKGLEFSGYASMSKARYDEYIDPATTAAGLSDPLRGRDLSSQRFTSIPDYQGGLSIKYTLPLPETIGAVSVRADGTYQSKSWWDPTKAAEDVAEQPAFGLLNVRADWTDVMGIPLDLAVYATNVTDKEYQVGGSVIAGIAAAVYGAPRMIAGEVTYRFGGAK